MAIDLPGHGTRVGERFTAEAAFATIDEAVAGFAVPPLLVGLSLGGYTSLAYAARREGALAGVVLAGCSTEIRGKPLGAYRRLAGHVTRTLDIGGDDWSVVTDMLRVLTGYSPLADLRELDVPVWLVNGRFDHFRGDDGAPAEASVLDLHVVQPRAAGLAHHALDGGGRAVRAGDAAAVRDLSAGLDGLPDEGAGLVLAERPGVVSAAGVAEAHAPHADRRDVQTGRTQFHVVHAPQSLPATRMPGRAPLSSRS